MMKRPHLWKQAKATEVERAPNPTEKLPERTFQFTPRGDVDAFVKFFSGDMRKR